MVIDSTFWVAVSFIIFFVGLIYLKVPHKINEVLNKLILAGGGDTVSAIKMANAENNFSYISNAGGAFLEWLEGKESPGAIALKSNNLILD